MSTARGDIEGVPDGIQFFGIPLADPVHVGLRMPLVDGDEFRSETEADDPIYRRCGIKRSIEDAGDPARPIYYFDWPLNGCVSARAAHSLAFPFTDRAGGELPAWAS